MRVRGCVAYLQHSPNRPGCPQVCEAAEENGGEGEDREQLQRLRKGSSGSGAKHDIPTPKKARGNRLMHAHGEDTKGEDSSKLIRPAITESWKRKIDDNQRRISSQAEQVVAAQSIEDEFKECRAAFFSQIEVLPVGSKRQRIDEDTSLERTSRRSLRESLIAKATELKHKQGRRLDDHLIHPAADKPKPKRIRLQGDDAITRLINLGRQHQDSQLGERVTGCDGRE